MLELTEITTWLNEKFNLAGQNHTPIYTFNINAEVGKNKGENVVNGVLISETPKITPIPNVKDYKYKLRVTLSVTAPTSNNNLKNIEKIVGNVVEEYNGKEIQFADGKGIITFTLTGTRDFKVEAGQGGIVPLTFYLDINYTEGLITSATKHWLLNDMEIPFQSESVIIEKNGRINPINDRKYQQVFMTTQMKWYHFRFPYVDSPLCNMLYKDMLDGDMNKRYTLKYYDGVSYTQENPYETVVLIFRNGDSDSQRPDTAMFDIMFADADDGLNKYRYELALFDNPFDASTENTRYFDNETEQMVWYEIVTENSYNKTMFNDILAPNLNSLVITNQIYQNYYYIRLEDIGHEPLYVTYNYAVANNYYYKVIDRKGDHYLLVSNMNEEEFATYTQDYDRQSGIGYLYRESNYNVFDLVNKNYAIIRVTSNDFRKLPTKPMLSQAKTLQLYYLTNNQYVLIDKNVTALQYEDIIDVYTNRRYFYYQISNANIGASEQVIYDLRLDSVQTWIPNSELQMQGSFIQKAHLDRWIYSYELLNSTPLEKPDFSDAYTYGYYLKTPDTNTIGENDTFTLVTNSVASQTTYNNANYVYEMVLTFNGKADSKLFEREDLRDLAKRLINRKKLVFDTSNLIIPNNLSVKNQNVWVYVFLDASSVTTGDEIKYNFCKLGRWSLTPPDTLEEIVIPRMRTKGIETATGCICFSLNDFYIGQYQFPTQTEQEFPEIADCYSSKNAFTYLLKNNPTLYSYIKTMKLSLKPPINFNERILTGRLTTTNTISPNYQVEFEHEYDGYQNDITAGTVSANYKIYTSSSNSSNRAFFFNIIYDNMTPFVMKVDENIIPENTFTKSEIIVSDKNKKFNPKINSMDYKEINLALVGSEFNFDIQKLNENDIKFQYIEPLTVDTTKSIIRYIGTEGNVFNENYTKSFNGLIYTNDLSLPLSTTAYENYLANNKNAYLSFQNQLNYNIQQTDLTNKFAVINNTIDNTSGFGKAIGKMTSLDFGGAAKETFEVGTNTAKMLSEIAQNTERVNIQNAYEKTKFDYSMDNMKNAPASLINSNGSALFANCVMDYAIYVEILEGLETELESANDVMFRDGYNLNRFEEPGENIKDYCHTRKYFNYVRATLGNITGVAMSDIMRADLKQRFSSGIRFWHQDTIDYSKENYELKIEQ